MTSYIFCLSLRMEVMASRRLRTRTYSDRYLLYRRCVDHSHVTPSSFQAAFALDHHRIQTSSLFLLI